MEVAATISLMGEAVAMRSKVVPVTTPFLAATATTGFGAALALIP